MSKPVVTADMSIEAMKELAKTPEGVKQLEEAGLVITKNTVSKLENVYEGQSQSPARRIKKLDLTGTPEEVVAKNPGLKYDVEQGKFFREVSWDGGKTMERMYVDASDPKGYFMIQYGKEPWDGALLGGTEAAKSYVEPNAYNATGAKNYLKPEEMGYEWTEASKAAPVRFTEVPEGVKGIVGKEGFQPITDGNQVIAIDVKGQPYINTVDYVRTNTKGLSQDAVKVLDKVEANIENIKNTNNALLGNITSEPTVPGSAAMKRYADSNGYSIECSIDDANLTYTYILKNNKGQIKEVVNEYGTKKYEYDASGRIKSRVTYNTTGSPTSFIKYEYQNDVITRTEYDLDPLFEKSPIRINEINADGKIIPPKDGGDWVSRPITQAEKNVLKEIKSINPVHEAGAEFATNLLGSRQIARMYLQNADTKVFTEKFAKLPKEAVTKTSTNTTVTDVAITVDKKGRRISSKELEPGNVKEYSDSYYNKQGELVAKREYDFDPKTGERTNLSKEIRYEDGVTYTKSYNKDGSVKSYSKSEEVTRGGSPQHKYTEYDINGRVTQFYIYDIRSNSGYKVMWNSLLERYTTDAV